MPFVLLALYILFVLLLLGAGLSCLKFPLKAAEFFNRYNPNRWHEYDEGYTDGYVIMHGFIFLLWGMCMVIWPVASILNNR